LSFFYCVEIQICKIKAEAAVHNQIIKAGFIVFSSKKPNFKLVDDNEILAGNKMYDIVTKKTCNGTTTYYAVSDNDEDEILTKLADTNKNNSAEKSLMGKTIKYSYAKYFTAKKPYEPACFFSGPALASAINTQSFYFSYFRDIFSPPPNCLAS